MPTPTIPGTELFQQWMNSAADPEQIEQRIKELKVIKFWLEQNVTAIDSSITALDLHAKTLTLVKENPFIVSFDPMQAFMNPMKMWADTIEAMSGKKTA